MWLHDSGLQSVLVLCCTASALTVGCSGVPALCLLVHKQDMGFPCCGWIICLLLLFYYEVKDYKKQGLKICTGRQFKSTMSLFMGKALVNQILGN